MFSASLPTLDVQNATVSPTLDARSVFEQWFAAFSNAVAAKDATAVSSLFIEDSYWRDMLALTGTFRTFRGLPSITQFLSDRIPSCDIHDLKLDTNDAVKGHIGLQQPYPDLVWIQGIFTFSIGDTGLGSGIFRLVPVSDGVWKAWNVFTNLENFVNYPEKIGALRNSEMSHGKWEEQREKEREFVNRDPSVVIIGGGQGGLGTAARLKALGIDALIVEKNARIGDGWRGRYKSLSLHDPVYYDHMPYLPFPPTWPVYTPALKLANWLENYAEVMELNIWTSAEAISVTQDESTDIWSITVCREGQPDRVIKTKHVVLALGFGASGARMPSFPGTDEFKGQIMHSTAHKTAKDYANKKVVIVGACASAHDIAADCHENGVDATMIQRGSTYVMSTANGWKVLMEGIYSEHALPTDYADRLSASFPWSQVGMFQRSAKAVAEADKGLLDGLRSKGFKLNNGLQETGFALLAWKLSGGYYLDTGASSLITSGAISLKNDSEITHFTSSGLAFANGSELSADVVIFATGFHGDPRQAIRKICGDIADRCAPIWGLDEEGEIKGAWRPLGPKGLFYMMGNLALCRFHSKHIALQIKAAEEGIVIDKYTAIPE